jgi:heme oxygenase (mycobilin-producing)
VPSPGGANSPPSSSTADSTGTNQRGRDVSQSSTGALLRSTDPRSPGAGCFTSGSRGVRAVVGRRGGGLRRERDFGTTPSLAPVLVVTRFDVPEDAEGFLAQAQAAVAAFAARPGFVRGSVGRAADDPTQWVLTTEWVGVGAYRRSLGSYDVKVDAAPLLSRGRDEASAFEVLHAVDGDGATVAVSRRAVDAATIGLGEAAGPASSDL